MVRTGRAVCTNVVVMEMYFARARGCIRFEGNENIAIRLYSSIMSAAAMRYIPAFGGVACETGTGLKFTLLYLRMHIPYRVEHHFELSC